MKLFLAILLLPLTVLALNDCPDGYDQIDGECWLFGTHPMTWNEASKFCHNHGAALISIFDKERQTLINHLTGRETYWTGLSTYLPGEYAWDSNEGSGLTLQGSGYENWGVNQPEESSSDRCVADATGTGWTALPCDEERLYFICVQEKRCQLSFDGTDGQCWITSIIRMTWSDAAQFCHRQGAILMPIFDQHAQTVLNYFANGEQYWTGLSSLSVTGQYVWDTLDGPALTLEDSSYENWGVGQPENDPSKRCVVDEKGTGWATLSCNEKLPFFCQQVKVCHDQRYVMFDEQCAHFADDPMTWKDASEFCHKEGAVLLPIFNKRRQEAADFMPGPHWTGLNSISKLGEYVWDSIEGSGITLEESGYENWGANQPVNDVEKRCVTDDSAWNLGWKVVSCDEKHYFACVKPDVPNNVKSRKTET